MKVRGMVPGLIGLKSGKIIDEKGTSRCIRIYALMIASGSGAFNQCRPGYEALAQVSFV
ncbi:hypothetical protein ACFLWN_04610 [Chloroflexota bacterium]